MGFYAKPNGKLLALIRERLGLISFIKLTLAARRKDNGVGGKEIERVINGRGDEDGKQEKAERPIGKQLLESRQETMVTPARQMR